MPSFKSPCYGGTKKSDSRDIPEQHGAVMPASSSLGGNPPGWVKPYDPKNPGIPAVVQINSTRGAYHWRSTFCGLSGRILPDLAPFIIITLNTTAWIVVWQFFPAWVEGMNIDYGAFAGLSFVMALLVSFRLTGAYSRWYEGRTQWAAVGRNIRDSSQIVNSFISKEDAEGTPNTIVEQFLALNIALPVLLKNYLRDDSDRDKMELSIFLTQKAVNLVTPDHVPHFYRWIYCIDLMRAHIALAVKEKLLDPWVVQVIEERIMSVNAASGACDRIKSTPLAYGYAVHIRTVLLAYFLFLPPILISNGTSMGAHILIMIVLVHSLLTVDQLAVQVEQPFGFDKLDLPLEKFCNYSIKQVQLVMKTNTSAVVSGLHGTSSIDRKGRSSSSCTSTRSTDSGFVNRSAADLNDVQITIA